MTHRIHLFAALLVVSGCAFEGASSGSDSLVVTDHCEMTGTGTLPSGDSFSGGVSGADIVVSGDWTHTSVDDGVIFGAPDWILCRINGATLGDFGGDATIDGAGGYTYRVSFQDFGEPSGPVLVAGTPEVRTLEATREHRPTNWIDGLIEERALVVLPSELPVTVGNAGNMWAWLSYQDAESGDVVSCRYRGGASRANPRSASDIAAGESYLFDRCFAGPHHGDASGDDGATVATAAGDTVEVDWISLHVHSGAPRFPSSCAQTTVSVDLDVTPLIEGEPLTDYYRLSVWDADGTRIILRDGNLASGDVRVTQL